MAHVLRLAGCIIVNEHGDILMLHRNTPRHRQWEIPGGKIGVNENPATAAVREAHEELGVKVAIVRSLGEEEFTQDDRTLHYTWFLAKITKGEPRLAEPHIFDKFGYFSPVMLGRRFDELSPNAQNFLQAMAYGRVEL